MYPYIQLGPVTISTYFLVISLATTLSMLWFLARASHLELSRLTAIDFTLVTLFCGFAGARLLHVFYEDPEFYSQHPLRVVEVWYGGFVFLGGLLGATLGAWGFCRWKQEAFFLWADLAAPCISLAYAIGRLACFLNGCCYGRHCELPWAVFMEGENRHPTQIYASLWEFMTLGVLLSLGPSRKSTGSLFGIWLVLHALGRILMEAFRDDPRGAIVEGLSLGTWMSVAALICGLGILWTRPRQMVSKLH